MPSRSVDLNDLARRRLCSQGIACPSSDPKGAVARLTAVQAQERPSAAWAIGLRSGATVEEVEKAVASGSIVRTWMMRGTLHFAASEDVRWILDLVAPKVIARNKRRREELHLDERTFERGREVLSDALKGRRLTRGEMLAALQDAGISTAGQRGYHILWRLALEGLICFGPMKEGEASFVLLDEWVPPSETLPREEALAWLACRYFDGHGPAGVQDLVWWSGITVSEARAAIKAAGERLTEERFCGNTYWSSSSGLREGETASVHLLPAFDEYIVGYRDRSAVLDGAYTKEVLSSNGMFYPIVVIDGTVRGNWKAERKKEVRIEVRPFDRLSEEEIDVLEEAVSRYGTFLGLPAKLSVRGH